jgi:hypothetical protein
VSPGSVLTADPARPTTLAMLGAEAQSGDRRRLSTFKILRAVSEPACGGYLDAFNGYDRGNLSIGLLQWSAGTGVPSSGGSRALGTSRARWRIDPGELWALVALYASREPEEFLRTLGDLGLGTEHAWGETGASLWCPQDRIYRTRPTFADATGTPRTLPATGGEYAAFGGWHWAYRFVMTTRTSLAFRTAMWDLARQRISDLLTCPWPGLERGGGGGDLARTVGDVVTGEWTVACVLRWHALRPNDVVRDGVAGPALTGSLERARRARPDLDWQGPPEEWGDQHEAALGAGLSAEAGRHRTLTQDLGDLSEWPSWMNAANPRRFSLPLSHLPAGERRLSRARHSADLDRRDLPGGRR